MRIETYAYKLTVSFNVSYKASLLIILIILRCNSQSMYIKTL